MMKPPKFVPFILIIVAVCGFSLMLFGVVNLGQNASISNDPPRAAATISSTISPIPIGGMRVTTVAPPTKPSKNSAKPSGIAAIKPSKPQTDYSTPAFTEQDVKNYVQGKDFHFGFRIGSSSPLVVREVKFLTTKEVETVVKSIFYNIPDDALLCLTSVSGTFSVSGIGGKSGTFTGIYLVYDAHTGNLLVEQQIYPDKW